MNRRIALALAALFAAPVALRAATDKMVPPAPSPTPVAKKKHRFFDTSELSKDRSLPADDKVPVTDDKPRKRKSITDQLHKDRSNDK